MKLFKRKNKSKNVIVFGRKNKKNRLEVYFLDYNKPFLYAKLYSKNKLVSEKELYINKDQIENGKIINVIAVIDQLKDLSKTKCSIDLIISSSMFFDSIISLPKISNRKIELLKRKEIKNNFEKYKNSYHLTEDKYAYNLGNIYTEHFISNDLINNWIEIAKGLNGKLSSITLFGNYLYNHIKNLQIQNISSVIVEEKKKNKNRDKKSKNKAKVNKVADYAFIYIYKNIATFIFTSNNQLSTFYSFSFNSMDEIITTFLLVIGKREIEFEKKTIKHIFFDTDISLEKLINDLKDISFHEKHLNLFKISNDKGVSSH